MARRAILGLALLLAMISDSSGQSPPEPPRQNSGGARQQTNTEQRDTDQAPPSAIKIMPAEQTQQKSTDREQNGPENRSDAWILSDKIAVVASIAAMLQFVALVATVFVLMCTAKRQLRAYVFVSDVKVLQFPTIPRITAEFKNFGQTPCDEIAFSYAIEVADFPLTKDLCIGPIILAAPMAPGSWFHRDNSFEITPEQRSAIDGGKAAIYIFGRLEYRDVFKGQRRHTNFRLVYTGDQFGRTGASKEGNDYS